VATKLALSKYGDRCEIVNAYIEEEHEDNRRFLADCERWFGRTIALLRDEKYGASTIEVFKQNRFIKSRYGAKCSSVLKRRVLDKFNLPGDVMVFGYTVEEIERFEDFQERNPNRPAIAPLVDAGLTKENCKAMLERAGIQLPLMYRLGYSNANCVGCVKGGEGYFRAIREDFPEQFEKLAAVEEDIGENAYLFRNRKTGKRYSLREIPAGKARRNDLVPQCGVLCELAEQDYALFE